MNIIEHNAYTEFLDTLSKTITPPKAIIVISAHRLTQGTFITGAEHPPQIYDFWGFPEELYSFEYAPKGDPELAKRIAADGSGIQLDLHRGIDHAAWAVLCHMYPDQRIPVLEISLDVNKTFEEHFELGKKLAKYRNENILLIGSGNIIHNLGDISFAPNAPAFDWAMRLDDWFKENIEHYDKEKLLNYYKYLPNHQQGIPTTEHYIPLLYILGMKSSEEGIFPLHESIQNGSISMRSIAVE